MKVNPNEPAMPFQYEEEYGDNGRKINHVFEGLTIRQHFAAMAMQGVINSYADGTKGNLPSGKIVAEYSVRYADALIKELNKETI